MTTTRTIKNVIGTGSADAGHAIQIEVEFDGGHRELLRIETHNAANLARAVIEASAIAEAQRRLQPGQSTTVEMPYRAQQVVAAPSLDGSTVALKFGTQQGIPLVIAMLPSLAQTTIERLTVALERLATQSPSRKN